MSIRVSITSHLFPADREPEAVLRDDLRVGELIDEIRREFRLPLEDYVLYVQGSGQMLNPQHTLEQARVRAGAVLVLTTRQRYGIRPPGAAPTAAHGLLRAANSGPVFSLTRQVSWIGRPNPKEGLLAVDVDLTSLDPSRSTSRPHARILWENGQHYLESLRADNPAFVNGSPLMPGQRQLLRAGDRLSFGKVTLTFEGEVV